MELKTHTRGNGEEMQRSEVGRGESDGENEAEFYSTASPSKPRIMISPMKARATRSRRVVAKGIRWQNADLEAEGLEPGESLGEERFGGELRPWAVT